MCGIVGLFLKDKSLEPKLGAMLTDMLITMTDRGPDSAGIAIYSGANDKAAKITVQSANPEKDFANLDADLKDAIGKPVLMLVKSTHAVLEVPAAFSENRLYFSFLSIVCFIYEIVYGSIYLRGDKDYQNINIKGKFNKK